MRKSLVLLLATTARTAAIVVPAWSAIHATAGGTSGPLATLALTTTLTNYKGDGAHVAIYVNHLRETRVGRLFEVRPDPERVV